MTKRSQKNARNGNGKTGCMSGLINMFDFRHASNSQKLLVDKRKHGNDRIASGNNRTREKDEMVNSHDDEKHEYPDYAGGNREQYNILRTKSVKMLIKQEMDNFLEKHINCAEEWKLCLDHGLHNDVQVSASGKEDCSKIHTNDLDQCDLRVSTNLVSRQPLPVETFSSYFNLYALLQDFYVNKYRYQTINDHRKDIHLSQNHLLQKALNEVLESFYRFFRASESVNLHQSDEFRKALEILGSDKDMFLRALQDPNSLLVKHIEDHLNSSMNNHSGQSRLLETDSTNSDEMEQKHGITANLKMIQRTNLKNLFISKKNKTRVDKKLDDVHSSQTSKRIVLLKPNTTKQKCFPNANSPGTSPRSPHVLRESIHNERAVFGFSFHEIKRRLRRAIGESKRERTLKSAVEVPYKTPSRFDVTNQRSSSDKQICQSAANGDNRMQKINIPTIGTKKSPIINNDPRSSNVGVPCKSLGYSKFEKEAKKHLFELLNCGSDSDDFPVGDSPQSLENILSLTDGKVSTPRCSAERLEESVLSLQSTTNFHSGNLIENVGKNQIDLLINNLEQNVCKEGQNVCKERQIREVDEEHCSSVCNSFSSSLGETFNSRREEMQFSAQHILILQQCLIEEVDEEHCSILNSIESTSSSETEVNVLTLEPLKSQTEDIVEASNRKGVVNVMDVGEVKFSMEEQRSIEPDTEALSAVAEGCQYDASLSQERSLYHDYSCEKTILAASGPLGNLNIQNLESPASIIEKTDRPSPISTLEPPFLDDITSPMTSRDNARLRISPRELHFEGYKNVDVPTKSLVHSSKRWNCMGMKEFKHDYIISLLEASDLFNYETWEKIKFPHQLLDPLFYDVVETSTGEIPDDLRLLFNCVNEVLEKIHQKYFSQVMMLSSIKSGICWFPSKQNLIQEVLSGTRTAYDLAAQIPWTLNNVIERDVHTGIWFCHWPGSENVEVDVGDKILEDMLEETVDQLWD